MALRFVGASAAALLLVAGCGSDPRISVGEVTAEHDLRLDVYGVARGSKLEICGVVQKDPFDARVPVDCVLPSNLRFDALGEVESRRIPIVVSPFIGAKRTFDETVMLDSRKREALLAERLAAVARGNAISPASSIGKGKPAHAPPGIAFTGSRVRAVNAERLEDVDVVVTVAHVNERNTGQTCAYTGSVSGLLHAFDADLEAFDAHTCKSLGKTRIANAAPRCPPEAYARLGESRVVSSLPSEPAIDAWALALKR